MRLKFLTITTDYIIERLKKHPYCIPDNKLEFELDNNNGEYSAYLNPHHQKYFNYGWFTVHDFFEWTLGIGKIVKGDTPEEKREIWKAIKFETKYKYTHSVYLDYKFFHLVDLNMLPNNSYNEYNFTPNKYIKVGDPSDLIKKSYSVIASYVLNDLKYSEDFNHNIDEIYREYREYALGTNLALEIIGVGYFGAINTPTSIYNLSWYRDLVFTYCIYKHLKYKLKEEEMPDYNIIFNING